MDRLRPPQNHRALAEDMTPCDIDPFDHTRQNRSKYAVCITLLERSKKNDPSAIEPPQPVLITRRIRAGWAGVASDAGFFASPSRSAPRERSPESLFGKDVAEAFRDMVGTLTKAALGSLDPVKFDELFNKLGKLEGAVGNMRGAFFELLVPEVVRKTSPAQVQQDLHGRRRHSRSGCVGAERRNYCSDDRMQGDGPGATVDDEEIGLWLTKRITRVRHHLSTLNWQGPKPRFELWTSGLLYQRSRRTASKERARQTLKNSIS